jgi:plasmid maintenance system antidote protein VapI
MTYPYDFGLAKELNRARAYDSVIAALEKAAQEEGMTQSKIAERMGRKRPQISAWLSGPSNWTLDTISDLLRAIDAEMEYEVVFNKDRSLSNHSHPLYAELPQKPHINDSKTKAPVVVSNSTSLSAIVY